MPLVDWNDAPRVRRISPAAVQLLTRLCVSNASVDFQRMTGKYCIAIAGKPVEYVMSRTVDALAAAAMIQRARGAAIPSYVCTDRARELVRLSLRERCEALGHPFDCSDPSCVLS
jgi:hypothetical protein